MGWRACPPPPQERPTSAPPRTAEASRVAPPRTPPPWHPLSTPLERTPSRQGAASQLPGQPPAATAQLARPHLPSRSRAGQRGQSARRRRGVGGRGGTKGARGGRGAAAASADAPPFRRVVTRPSASAPRTSGPVWATRHSQPHRATFARARGALPVEGGRGGEGCAGPSRDCGIFFSVLVDGRPFTG